MNQRIVIFVAILVVLFAMFVPLEQIKDFAIKAIYIVVVLLIVCYGVRMMLTGRPPWQR